jgi:hypothetical protein
MKYAADCFQQDYEEHAGRSKPDKRMPKLKLLNGMKALSVHEVAAKNPPLPPALTH